jgi:hypothetical protein
MSSVQLIDTKQIVTISDYGNNHDCTSLADIKETLGSKYTGKDVALVWVTPTGMKQVRFIKVADDGTVFESYTEKKFLWDELVSYLY